LDERIAEYMDIVDNPEKIDQHKVKCEYKNLDDTLGGMTPGQLIILAARPAM
jgi:replicative DNA helicase